MTDRTTWMVADREKKDTWSGRDGERNCEKFARSLEHVKENPRLKCRPRSTALSSCATRSSANVSQLETQHDSTLTSRRSGVARGPRKSSPTVASEHFSNTTNGRPSKPLPTNFYDVDAREATLIKCYNSMTNSSLTSVRMFSQRPVAHIVNHLGHTSLSIEMVDLGSAVISTWYRCKLDPTDVFTLFFYRFECVPVSSSDGDLLCLSGS